MSRYKTLKPLVFIFISAVILLPVYTSFFLIPPFNDILTKDSENDALLLSNFLKSLLFDNKNKFSEEIIKEKLQDLIEEDYLLKVKLFLPTGEVIFSTDEKDIGQINTKDYYHSKIAKGRQFTKIIKKDSKSLEGQLIKRDVVETYVPIMIDGKFTGAFEIYLNMTDNKNKLYELILHSTVITFMVSTFLLLSVIYGSVKIKNIILERHKKEEEILKDRDDLEDLVKQRTSELSNTNIMLIKEIDDRKKIEKEILHSKQEWERTFDAINDPITIHDTNFNIIKANKAARKLLNINSERGSSFKCYEHFHKLGQIPEWCPGNQCIKTKNPSSFEFYDNKNSIFEEIRVIPKYDNNNKLTGFIHVIRDITDRKHAEETNKLQLKRLDILRSIDRAILGTFDLRVILDILLEHIISQLNIDAASVMLYNHRTQTLDYLESKGFKTSALKYTKLSLGESYAGRAAIERRIISIPNLKDENNGFSNFTPFVNGKFISYLAVPLIAKGKIKGVLELFRKSYINTESDWLEFLEAISDLTALALDNASLFNELQRTNFELVSAYDSTIIGWSRAMDLRDKETEGHTRRVTSITVKIANELGIMDEEIIHLKRGALLHDIGKMGVPDSILLKPGKLTDKEWAIMKQHSDYAYEMLYPIKYLRPVIDIPHYHHEKWDGTGYPKGLKKTAIPLSARIFAVADVWDALSSDRPYRKAWPKEKVREYIKTASGTHFAPEIVDVFLSIDW